jgi:hypothetical protein
MPQGQMWRGADPVLVLRLLCLLSWTGGGLPRKHGDSLRSEFLAAYGHQHLLTLNNLERAGGRCTYTCVYHVVHAI